MVGCGADLSCCLRFNGFYWGVGASGEGAVFTYMFGGYWVCGGATAHVGARHQGLRGGGVVVGKIGLFFVLIVGGFWTIRRRVFVRGYFSFGYL